ncbi:MAG: isoleucine--tRNA ligase [Planctomycetota bacterium]|nr:MAG: isoleucine--tRNA ligase [Planctomycetota bacterium]
MSKQKSYKATLLLPKTSFSMKANLLQREPQWQKRWNKMDLYRKIRQSRQGQKSYILHDGPPYANGNIHMGHVINKVLKDMVVKYKTMRGLDSPFVPGWDCHGLPIEAKVVEELGERAKRLSKPQIRKKCQQYAQKYIRLQSKQFQQLGVFGDFENPYLTYSPAYERGILEVFAKLVGAGLVYKQLKPIHWCSGCQTALAEAELEYEEISSPSIYVNFPLQPSEKLVQLGLKPKGSRKKGELCLMIWTTTPWTLAANLAVAVHPQLEYAVLEYEQYGKVFRSLVALERVQAVVKAGKLSKYKIGRKRWTGAQLEGLSYAHPYLEASSNGSAFRVVLADYVTTTDGTGLVHTAPGHGAEDYFTGQRYGLEVYSPVRGDGCYDASVPSWLEGRHVLEADERVIQELEKRQLLFAQERIMHSYPHCWRSRDPVIFRATEQWFIHLDKRLPRSRKTLRQLALESLEKIKWIPAWGQRRIEGMLQARPDWCISRQRSWGLPIPVFTNGAGETLLTEESVLAVAQHIGQKGSDSWFTDTPQELLGKDFPLPPGWSWEDIEKEENIFDVWFESGSSWHSVVVAEGWNVPVDLYLEGSDQHRGWFQLSLLPALGAMRKPPFRAVLTHGFVVDEHGRKQSKSLGNYVDAQAELAKYGADILRLWVSSVNYQEDIRCNEELIARMQDTYRKIRNTLRYLFGNLHDFHPHQRVPYRRMSPIDRWAMERLEELIAKVRQAYEDFLFHKVHSLLYNFCVVEMSSIYLDVMKDRMYCEAADSPLRRSAQSAMYAILTALIRLLAPILVHTAEEAWQELSHKDEEVESVHLAHFPHGNRSIRWRQNLEKWTPLLQLRDRVLQELEKLRQEKTIQKSQEAAITITTSDAELVERLEEFGLEEFATFCIVSEVRLNVRKKGKTSVSAEKVDYAMCQRCWNYRPSVGENQEHPDLCARCWNVIIGQK